MTQPNPPSNGWVSGANTQSITLRVGQVITPAPSFAGAYSVTDTGECSKLVVNWRPGTARNKGSETIYDVYRATSVAPGDGTAEPTFVPSAANRVAAGLRKTTSFTDTGLTVGQVYYYIVQARDSKTGKVLGRRSMKGWRIPTRTTPDATVVAISNAGVVVAIETGW